MSECCDAMSPCGKWKCSLPEGHMEDHQVSTNVITWSDPTPTAFDKAYAEFEKDAFHMPWAEMFEAGWQARGKAIEEVFEPLAGGMSKKARNEIRKAIVEQ